jgi:hypothetical protein
MFLQEGQRMKKLLLLGSFIISSLAWSNSECDTSSEDLRKLLQCNVLQQAGNAGSAPQANCLDGRCNEATVRLGNRNQSARLPGLTAPFSSLGATQCTNFIQNDGTFGPWGQIVDNYITQPSVSERFLGNNVAHITDACPRWAQLNREQRRHFWAWVFAAIAWDESKCRANARNPRGTNGVAVGLLQMEERRASRTWRGPNCRAQTVTGARENILCGMDIMAELLKGQNGEYKGAGAILRNGTRNTSYWEKLRRPNGGVIGEMIKTHPLCQR